MAHEGSRIPATRTHDVEVRTLLCALKGARTRILNLMHWTILPIFLQAGLEIELEKPLPIADSQDDERRVADLVVSCDDGCRTIYVDLAVANPQASRYLIARERPVDLPLPVCTVTRK